MKYAITLKQLRQHGAGYSGYNKLVRAFTRKAEDRETPDEIQLAYIAKKNGLADALWCLKCLPGCERDARLFAVWCARQVEHLLTDQRSRDALDTAERYANDLATHEELAAAGAAEAAEAAAGAAEAAEAAEAAAWAAWAAEAAAGTAGAAEAAAWAARAAAGATAWVAGAAAEAAAWAAQKEMFIKMCNDEAPWQMKANTP